MTSDNIDYSRWMTNRATLQRPPLFFETPSWFLRIFLSLVSDVNEHNDSLLPVLRSVLCPETTAAAGMVHTESSWMLQRKGNLPVIIISNSLWGAS